MVSAHRQATHHSDDQGHTLERGEGRRGEREERGKGGREERGRKGEREGEKGRREGEEGGKGEEGREEEREGGDECNTKVTYTRNSHHKLNPLGDVNGEFSMCVCLKFHT